MTACSAARLRIACLAGLTMFLSLLRVDVSFAQEKPLVGLIPKAGPITMDGKLDDWQGAFVTPVHVGHPDFANRGGQFFFLGADQNLYIGLQFLDQEPPHVSPDKRKHESDAVGL